MQLLRVELQTLVSPASVGPLVAPVPDDEADDRQSQESADNSGNLPRPRAQVSQQRQRVGVEEGDGSELVGGQSHRGGVEEVGVPRQTETVS